MCAVLVTILFHGFSKFCFTKNGGDNEKGKKEREEEEEEEE